MSGISIKAVVIGVAIDIGGGLLAVIVFAGLYAAMLLGQGVSQADLQHHMLLDKSFFVANVILGDGFLAAGAFVAARLARVREVEHAALVAALGIAITFGLALALAEDRSLYPSWYRPVAYGAALPVALVAGYVARRFAKSARLDLVPCTPQQLLTLMEQPDRFEQVAGLPVAEGLHGFYVSDAVSPQWIAALRKASEPDPWRHGFFVVHRAGRRRLVIGSAGFKGPPDADGIVEIAYGIVPAYAGRGYATEAAAALVTYAFDHGARQLRAHTLPLPNASTHVLLKCGFQNVGSVVDPDDGPVWRWERGR